MISPIFRRCFIRRPAGFAVAFCISTLLLIRYASSHDNGETGRTNKPGDSPGCSCHCTSAKPATVVKIETDASNFEVGKSYTFTLSVTNPGESDAGCDISVKRGTLTAGSDGLKKSGTQLTHRAPKTLPASWTFNYIAPATAGSDTIYAVGNAVNGDGNSGGNGCSDEYNFAPKFIINVTAPTKNITLSRNIIDFGLRRIGTSASDTMKIISSGALDLKITASTMAIGSVFTNSPTSGARSIIAGQSETQTVDFKPKIRGKFTDTLIINSDATLIADQRKAVIVTGTGIAAEFSGLDSLNFGNQRVGSKKILTYTISNKGDEALSIIGNPIVSGKGFTFESSAKNLNIPAGKSDSIQLGFQPDSRGIFAGSMGLIALNNIVIPSIQLSGTGIAPQISVEDSVVSLLPSKTGRKDTVTLKMANVGEDTLHITDLTILNTKQGTKFVISEFNALSLISQSNGEVAIIYTPTTISKDTAILSISSNDPISPSKQVMIIGEGSEGTNAVNTSPLIPDFLITVSPNPSNGKALVKVVLRKSMQAKIEFVDAGGREISQFDKSIFEVGEYILPLKQENLSNGRYFIRAISNGRIITEKAIVILR